MAPVAGKGNLRYEKEEIMTDYSRRSFLKSSGIALGMSALGGLALTGCTPQTGADEGAALADTGDETAPLKVKLCATSPTGNGLSAGLVLAGYLSDDVEVIDRTSYLSREETHEFGPDDLVIVLTPTIAGRTPEVDNLFANLKGNDTPCIAVACFGNRCAEMTCAIIAENMTANGFNVIGGIEIVTDHVLGRFLGHGRPDDRDRAAMSKFAEDIKEKLSAGEIAPVEIVGDESCYENYNPKGTIYKSTTVKEYYADNCTKCGTCARECTAAAINAETLEIDEDVCVHCQRCTYVCPNRGRYFFPASEFEQGDHYWSRKDVVVHI